MSNRAVLCNPKLDPDMHWFNTPAGVLIEVFYQEIDPAVALTLIPGWWVRPDGTWTNDPPVPVPVAEKEHHDSEEC